MINMDVHLLEFIQNNFLTLGLIFGIIKAFAATYNLEKLGTLVDAIKGSFATLRNRKK